MKKVLMLVIAICAISCAVIAESKTQIQKAEEMLNHSNTYYWLSRARNNVLSDVNKSLEFAKSAKNILEKENKNDVVLKLIGKADAAILETENQANFNSGYLWDFSQLIPLLIAEDDIYEEYDDIDNIAIFRGVDTLINNSKKERELDQQIYLVIVSNSKNKIHEEVAHGYINGNTTMYALTKHEILSAITQVELDAIYADTATSETMQKLSDAFSKEGIGVLRISQNDKVNDVSYFGSTFSFWNSETKSFGNSFYADGLCERPINSLWIYSFVLIGLFFTFFYNQLNKNKSKGSFPPFWYGIAIAAFIAFFEYMSFMGIKASEVIDAGPIVTSPKGLLGIGILLLVIAVLPPILVYISSIKISHVSKILNNPETISAIYASSILGSITYLSTVGILRYDVNIVLANAGIALIAIIYPAFAIGKTYSRHNLQEDFLSGGQAALIATANLAMFYFFIKYNTNEILISAIALNLFTIIIHLLLPFVITSIQKFKNEQKEEKKSSLEGLSWLQDQLDTPPYFICNQPVFDKAVKWITEDDDDKIDMIFIEADQGCGKTRMAWEIAKKIQKEHGEESIILFGDCDEPSDGGIVTPYEPFAQALGNFLGVGQFANPAEKAERLKSGLAGFAIDAAMNASGVGAFSSLLGAEESGESAKTNTKEMTKVIAETLTGISKDKKIIFILDDTQWMDDESFELFELLLNELNDNFNDNQINFILTSRKVDDDDKVKALFEKLDNTDNKEGKIDIIDVITIEEEDLQSDDIVLGVLDNLRFDYNAQEQLNGYFAGENRPLPVLMTLKLLFDRKYIVEIGDRFELDKSVNLAELPSPDYYSEILQELTADLTLRESNLLQCCAIIGRKFNVSTISQIFGISILDCLELIKKAVEKNIIEDVLDEDDVFQFVEKRVCNMFKTLNLDDDSKQTQEIREYHKRFVDIYEKEDLKTMSYKDIVATAQHATAVKDVYPELVVKYNRIAAIKTQNRGLFKSADKFFKNASEVLEARKSIISNEEIAEFYLGFAKCLLDQEKDIAILNDNISKMKDNLELSEEDDFKHNPKSYYQTELKLIEILGMFKDRKFDNAVAESEKIINDAENTKPQKMRAAFYRAISWNRQEYDKCKELHLGVFDDIEIILKDSNLLSDERVEILKVKSELSNNLGFVTMRSEPDLAKKHFEIAIEINEMPAINDQKGIGIANGGIGDCLSATGDLEGAKKAYLLNYDISKTNGDNQGIGRMSSMLGGLLLRQLSDENKEENLAQAAKYYRESLNVALNQNNGISIAFAIAGLISVETERDIPKLDYILSKYKEFSTEGLPDFATGALNGAIAQFAEKHNNFKDVFNK